MTKSEAIKQLKDQIAPKGQQASLEAVSMAITALETEKEPDTAGTVTSSKEDQMKILKKMCYQYDSTKSKICQENFQQSEKIAYEDLILEISIPLNKASVLMGVVLEEYDFAEIPAYPDYINWGRKKISDATRKERNAGKIMIEYPRLLTYITVISDQLDEIRKIIDPAEKQIQTNFCNGKE